jgi:hypothetical protein
VSVHLTVVLFLKATFYLTLLNTTVVGAGLLD